jgi:hypothetical protein
MSSLKRLTQEDYKLKTSQGYIARPSKTKTSQTVMAHTYNPSYSGGSDQQDLGSKPARPYLKKTHHKK